MLRRRKFGGHVSRERWLVSYADFITLLFAFFTTMYAISTVDAQKMGKMVMSMRASFESGPFAPGNERVTLAQAPGSTGLDSEQSLAPNVSISEEAMRELRRGREGEISPLGKLKREVELLVGPEALNTRVRTHMEGRGLVISLGEGGFFDSGSDVLKPEGRKLLDAIASGLVSTHNHIRVEGHTDNLPIKNSKFPSNWELSTARATAVVSCLIVKYGFDPQLLSAAGYGEYRPASSNATAEGRARNRRVDIVVLSPVYARMEPR